MSIGLRLDLRQSQQLVMTPQLQQAIKLLTMSNMELADFVATEIEKNPLLDIAGPDRAAPEAEGRPPDRAGPEASGDENAQAEQAEQAVAPEMAGELAAPADLRVEDHGLAGDTFDTGGENLHDTSPSDGPPPQGEAWSRPGASHASGAGPALEERLAMPLSLRDHLRAQLGQMADLEEEAASIARYLVEELDDYGFLRASAADLADRLEIGRDAIEAGLKALQSCDPAGVGARTVGECLHLQLMERGPVTPEMARLLDNLDLLGRGDLRRLRSLCRVDAERLSAMVAEIRSLDPRPCAEFDTVEPETLVPDILVTKAAWGGWSLELNPETLPNVLVNRDYRAQIDAEGCAITREFLAECESNANWLIRSMDQRARTILKVASEILRRQERFFAEGISGLQPLTLKAVAEALDLHESTVSRVTSNKYMATGRGIFELKFFFSNAVGSDENDIAAESVRQRIKIMVRDEANRDVMSDDAIVDKLKSEGIDIARRTVAKYRKSLNIPSSVERRRLRALEQGL